MKVMDYLKAAQRLRKLLSRLKDDPELNQIVEFLERLGLKQKEHPVASAFREVKDLFSELQLSPIEEFFKGLDFRLEPSKEEARLRKLIEEARQDRVEQHTAHKNRVEALQLGYQNAQAALQEAQEKVNTLYAKKANLESDKAARDYQIEALQKEVGALREQQPTEDLSGRYLAIIDAKQAEIDRLKAAVPSYELLDTLRRYCIGVVDPSSTPVDERLKLFQQLLAMVS